MKVDVSEMTLLQGLNALQQLMVWATIAKQEREDFQVKNAMRGMRVEENGVSMSFYWREEAIIQIINDLRAELDKKFGKKG